MCGISLDQKKKTKKKNLSNYNPAPAMYLCNKRAEIYVNVNEKKTAFWS